VISSEEEEEDAATAFNRGGESDYSSAGFDILSGVEDELVSASSYLKLLLASRSVAVSSSCNQHTTDFSELEITTKGKLVSKSGKHLCVVENLAHDFRLVDVVLTSIAKSGRL
jgi:hypothetical protein